MTPQDLIPTTPNRGVRLAAFAAAAVLSAGLLAGCSGSREDGSVGLEGDDNGPFTSNNQIEPRQVGPDDPTLGGEGTLNEDVDGAVGTDATDLRDTDDGFNDSQTARRDRRNTRRAPAATGGTQTLSFPVDGEVILSATSPATVRVGEAFNYELTVTNNTGVPVHDVEVIAYRGGSDDAETIWDLGALPAGAAESKTFEIVGEQIGSLSNCLAVDYTPTLCLNTEVVQPELALVKSGPSEAAFCDQFNYTYTVTNEGNGPARNVVITDDLPDGLFVVANGPGSDVEVNVGDLAGGQSQTVNVLVEASEPGTYSSRGQASSADLEVNSGEVETAIREAQLELSAEGPDATYVGVPVDYRLVVTNTGDAATNPGTLDLALTGAAEALQTRDIPALQPGEEQVYRVTTRAGGRSGDMSLRATVAAPCAKADDIVASVDTQVQAISALQLEVIDTQDPVRLGDETVYIITVLNEGSQEENNVQLSGTLPDTLEFVGGTGAGDVTGDGQTVTFSPVTIDAGNEAKWEVTVRAIGDGQGQFELKLSAPTLTRDAVEDEPTRAFDPGSIRRREVGNQ